MVSGPDSEYATSGVSDTPVLNLVYHPSSPAL